MSSLSDNELEQLKKDFPELADIDNVDDLDLDGPVDLGDLPDLTEEELNALLEDPDADLDRAVLSTKSTTKAERKVDASEVAPGSTTAAPSTSHPKTSSSPNRALTSESLAKSPKLTPSTSAVELASAQAAKHISSEPKQSLKPTAEPIPAPARQPVSKAASSERASRPAAPPPATKPVVKPIAKSVANQIPEPAIKPLSRPTPSPQQATKKPALAPANKAQQEVKQTQARPSTPAASAALQASVVAKVSRPKAALSSRNITAANPVSSPAKKNKPANASASPNLKASGKTINPDPKPVANGNTKDKAAEERKLEEMRAKLLKSMTERRLAKEKQEQAEKKRQFSPAGRKRPAESEEFPNRSVKRAVTAPSGGLTIRGAAEAQAKAQQLTSPGRTPMDLMNRHLQGGTGNQSPVASRGRGVKNPLPDATPVDTIVKPGRAINRNGFSIAGRAMQNTLRQTQTPSPIQKRLSANPVPINERLGRNHQEQQQQKKQNQNRPWQRKSQRQSAQ